MPRVAHPTATCNAKILNKAKVERQKRAERAKAGREDYYSGPIDDTTMEIRAGEIVAKLPDGSVTSALNGCLVNRVVDQQTTVQSYPILGVAIATSTPNPNTRDPHTMVNVAVAGSVPVRNVGKTTFYGGDEVFAVYPTMEKDKESTVRTGRKRDSSQVKLFSLVKGTSTRPIYDAIKHNTTIGAFWRDNYDNMRRAAGASSNLTESMNKLAAGRLNESDKDTKILLKQLKMIVETLRDVFVVTRGHRLGIVEENKQAFPGEEMSVYITPPH